MRYKDRRDAGRCLAEELSEYKGQKDTIVLGLPRGGVEVAYEVAQLLGLPLDVTCPHKIGAPAQKELAIGAITETGEGQFNERLVKMMGVDEEYLYEEVERRSEQAKQRLELYRAGMPPRVLKDKTVLIVDDGLATGATMKAAIASVRAEKAKKIVAAVPVSPPDTLEEIEELADEVVCPQVPGGFMAVGQFFEDFGQTTDDTVIELLRAAQ